MVTDMQLNALQKVKDRLRKEILNDADVSSPVEWAEKYRIIPNGDSIWPGRFSFDRVPFMREIAECFSVNSPVKEVAFKKASQVMGTTSLTENIIGYYLHAEPCNILLVANRANIIETNIQPRLLRMINETPIKDKMLSSVRGKFNTYDAQVILRGATKPDAFRNYSARVLILEELTGYPESFKREGPVKELAKARTSTYESVRKILYISSALNHGDDMDQLFLAGDQRYYHIPCPHCNHYQKLVWQGIKYEVDEQLRIKKDSVFYECAVCKKAIKEEDKTQIFSRGIWRAEDPEKANEEYRSYHLSALYSPYGMHSWAAIAGQFETAKIESGNKMRAFYNTVLGENYSETAVNTPTLQQMLARLSDGRLLYNRGQSPVPILYATVGVDVQQDRLEVEVVGWEKDKRNYSVNYYQLHGDPALLHDEEGCWTQLNQLLNAIEAQGILSVCLIDAGNKPGQIYDYIASICPHQWTYPIMGEAPLSGEWPYKQKPVEGYADMIRLHLNTPYFKRLFIDDAFRPMPRDSSLPERYVGFPADYDEVHFERLFRSERVEIKRINGIERQRWVQVKKDNHPLDARVYAMAGAFFLRELISKHILYLDRVDSAAAENYIIEAIGAKTLDLRELYYD